MTHDLVFNLYLEPRASKVDHDGRKGVSFTIPLAEKELG